VRVRGTYGLGGAPVGSFLNIAANVVPSAIVEAVIVPSGGASVEIVGVDGGVMVGSVVLLS